MKSNKCFIILEKILFSFSFMHHIFLVWNVKQQHINHPFSWPEVLLISPKLFRIDQTPEHIMVHFQKSLLPKLMRSNDLNHFDKSVFSCLFWQDFFSSLRYHQRVVSVLCCSHRAQDPVPVQQLPAADRRLPGAAGHHVSPQVQVSSRSSPRRSASIFFVYGCLLKPASFFSLCVFSVLPTSLSYLENC